MSKMKNEFLDEKKTSDKKWLPPWSLFEPPNSNS